MDKLCLFVLKRLVDVEADVEVGEVDNSDEVGLSFFNGRFELTFKAELV